MLQVIFFALVLGVILAKLGDSADTVSALFSQGNDIMMEMTMMVMSVAPVGVFCLIAKTFLLLVLMLSYLYLNICCQYLLL